MRSSLLTLLAEFTSTGMMTTLGLVTRSAEHGQGELMMIIA